MSTALIEYDRREQSSPWKPACLSCSTPSSERAQTLDEGLDREDAERVPPCQLPRDGGARDRTQPCRAVARLVPQRHAVIRKGSLLDPRVTASMEHPRGFLSILVFMPREHR